MRSRLVQMKANGDVLLLFLVGSVLRIVYAIATKYDVRGHDVGGHIDYIVYLARNHYALPPVHGGLEYYHPPLYYMVMAPLYQLGTFLGWSEETSFTLIQSASIFLSIVTLALGLWIGLLLFEQKDRLQLLSYGAIITALPSLIFFAARINNDVLASFLAFLSLLVLLQWWRRPGAGWWIFFSVLVGLGLLTKSSAVLLLVVGWVCLTVRADFSLGRKFLALALSLLIVLAIAGWFHIPRALQETDKKLALIGNRNILTNFVPNSSEAFFVFSPAAMVRIPFNHAFEDSFRRMYFWEFYFRSGLFGEFQFEDRLLPLGSVMIVFALEVLLLAVLGFSVAMRNSFIALLPMHATTVVWLIGMVVYRYAYPYSSSQDFRYTILLSVPLGYYVARGIGCLPPRIQMVAVGIVAVFTACCGIFITALLT